LNRDTSNWFNPNTTAVLQALESAGFKACLVLAEGERAIFHATVKEGLPEYLAIESAESVFYDVISRPLFGLKKQTPGSARWTPESRRQIEEFPVTGVGPSVPEILAQQEPFEPPPPAEPTDVAPPAVEPAPARTVGGTVKRLGKKALRKLLHGSA
jgi:hypothetical protein